MEKGLLKCSRKKMDKYFGFGGALVNFSWLKQWANMVALVAMKDLEIAVFNNKSIVCNGLSGKRVKLPQLPAESENG